MAIIVIRFCVLSEVPVPTLVAVGTVVSVFCFLCEKTIVITETDCVHHVMRA